MIKVIEDIKDPQLKREVLSKLSNGLAVRFSRQQLLDAIQCLDTLDVGVSDEYYASCVEKFNAEEWLLLGKLSKNPDCPELKKFIRNKNNSTRKKVLTLTGRNKNNKKSTKLWGFINA